VNNMSQLIQESKYITVQEFLPKWTDFMESHERRAHYTIVQQEHGLDIMSCRRCLLGESYGFGEDVASNLVNCGQCHKFAVGYAKINGLNYLDATFNLKNFYTFKQGLYDHFMTSHPERLERK